MNYKLDGISISNYGARPATSGQCFALNGMLDLPKRIGKTEHDWGTTVEPFVQSSDIQLDGRLLTLHVVVKAENLDAFKNACIACKVLSTTYDSYDVVCRDEIKVRELGQYLFVQVDFWQNKYSLKPITIIPSISGLFRLDGFDLKRDFGISIAQSNNLLNTAKRIDVGTTEFYEKTNYRGLREISLRCSMIGNSFADVHNKMNQFQSLIMAPGMRTLATPKKILSLYFKDGIVVNIVRPNILQFTLKGISL